MSNLAVQWHSARQSVSTEHLVFCSPDDTPFDIDAIDLIWWRRSCADQDQAKAYTDQATADLINQDWRGALRGGLLSRYMGSWVRPLPLRALRRRFHILLTRQSSPGTVMKTQMAKAALLMDSTRSAHGYSHCKADISEP